jgi:hypothetical protein
MKVLELFRESFTTSFDNQMSHQLVYILFGMLKDIDIRISRTTSRIANKSMELLIMLLDR